jgi:hypothetical protein
VRAEVATGGQSTAGSCHVAACLARSVTMSWKTGSPTRMGSIKIALSLLLPLSGKARSETNPPGLACLKMIDTNSASCARSGVRPDSGCALMLPPTRSKPLASASRLSYFP